MKILRHRENPIDSEFHLDRGGGGRPGIAGYGLKIVGARSIAIAKEC